MVGTQWDARRCREMNNVESCWEKLNNNEQKKTKKRKVQNSNESRKNYIVTSDNLTDKEIGIYGYV